MPFTHVAGGLKSPTRQSRSGDGAPPLPCTGGFIVNGFTLNGLTGNGFTVDGFTAPVDVLRHGRCRKPFRMRRYEKRARKSFGIRTYKNKGLKVSWNEQLQKNRGGPPLLPCLSLFLSLSTTRFTMSGKLHYILGFASDAATR